MERKENIKLQLHTASILMMVASADEKIEGSEVESIKKILLMG